MIGPDTPLEELPGLSSPVRNTLAGMGLVRLRDLAQRPDELRHRPGIGPATLDKLTGLLQQAGLSVPEAGRSPAAVCESRQAQAQIQAALFQQARDWVHRYQPEVHQRWQAHKPGAYGDCLRAQLDALDQLPAPADALQEARNTLVRQLSRYERQRRHAGGREAQRDRHRAMSGRRRPV